MGKKKNPMEQSAGEARKLANPNTRGKNAAAQKPGQSEQVNKQKGGQYAQAGEPPRMEK